MPDDIEESPGPAATEESPAPFKIPTRLVLKTPVEIDGKKLTELNMDFASMPGREIFKLEAWFRKKYGSSNEIAICLDERYQMMVVAKLNGITPEGLEQSDLNGEDVYAVEMMRTAFFRTVGSDRMKTS